MIRMPISNGSTSPYTMTPSSLAFLIEFTRHEIARDERGIAMGLHCHEQLERSRVYLARILAIQAARFDADLSAINEEIAA